jgi:flagellar basal-body rod protein FlgG
MLDALYISAVGLQAQKAQLDAVAGNFANASTTAYKRQSLDFSAALDRVVAAGLPASTAEPSGAAGASAIGQAWRVDLAQGELHPTGRALDVAIAGPGFAEVELGDGRVGYSRLGALQVSDDGLLTLASGVPLKADVRVPADATAIEIRPDGEVAASLEGERTPSVLGRIELVTFAHTEALRYRGEGVFVARDAGVDARRAEPGETGAGRLVAGQLEGSNVRMVDEMVSLLLMQRVYELNAKVVQAADELMGMTNNLRRG